MIDNDELARRLRAALARHSRIRGVAIADDARLNGSVGLDSFALLNALLDVEDETGVHVDPARLAGVREMTLRDLLALLDSSSEPGADRPGGHAPGRAP